MGRTRIYGHGAQLPLGFVAEVRVVSDANVVIATFDDVTPATIDGVDLAIGDTVLLAGQTDPTENGVYTVADVAPSARHTSFDTDPDWFPGAMFEAQEGTVYAKTKWQVGSPAPIVVGTTSIVITRVRDTIGIVDAAYLGEVQVQGGIANTGVPAAVITGDAVANRLSEFGDQYTMGYDQGSGSMQVTDINPALTGSIIVPFTTLTTPPETTTGHNVQLYKHITFQYVVASIGTSVTVKLEGSLDGTNWFDLADDGMSTVETANDTYKLYKSNFKAKFVRFNWEAEDGGTPTIAVTLIAGN